MLIPLLGLLAIDLQHATIATPEPLTPREQMAVRMLAEEVSKRTGITWPVAEAGLRPTVSIRHGKGPAEGYRIASGTNGVQITGFDDRGILFGIGRLLRELRLAPNSATFPDGFQIETSPNYPLRGHQLGYRPKNNTYDGWTIAQFEEYLRDLAVFGSNAVELIPPRSDDDAESPNYPQPPMQTMIEVSRVADRYGLDVWVWYPALDKDYTDPKTVDAAVAEWTGVLRQLPRLDAVFVPGGDPGHTAPGPLMALLAKQTAALRRIHPKVQMWLSPQGFNEAWLQEFYRILRTDQPAWLTGVVFGPQIRSSLADLRRAVPSRYPIRHYPDITHTRQCQYPVPDWDLAHAVTSAREPINPRPVDQTIIFRLLQPLTMGFLTYSEGVNDDVNKFLWSGLGWDPDSDPREILRQYARYFIGDAFAESFSKGLFDLERNWRGPLASNDSVEPTLREFQEIERQAGTKAVKENWRLQLALYRAYYDAYQKQRLALETDAERDALKLLAAGKVGEAAARLTPEVPLSPLRSRVFELAGDLYRTIRMQLSVKLYKASDVDRGATLDTVDFPLNNRTWLLARIAAMKSMRPAEREAAIREITQWKDPGSGGYYDDPGDPLAQPHVVRGRLYAEDPAFLNSPLVGFEERVAMPKTWWTHAEALNDAPLTMRYTGLDPAAQYRLKVVYAGDSLSRKIQLTANGVTEIHPLIAKPKPITPLTVDIPKEATRGGTLTLEWRREPGLGGNGRGAQVSEVWLIKQ